MEANNSLWDSVNPTASNDPKIVFEFNIPVVVTFPNDFTKPDEYESTYSDQGGKYCVFKVLHEGETSAIVTSAFSLLRGLKALEPLAGKSVKITKKLDKGKQQYIVEQA